MPAMPCPALPCLLSCRPPFQLIMRLLTIIVARRILRQNACSTQGQTAAHTRAGDVVSQPADRAGQSALFVACANKHRLSEVA